MEKTKKFIAEQKVGQAWARTLTFLKLSRMKIESKTYKKSFELYKFPLLTHFRDMEYALRAWGNVDSRTEQWFADCPFKKDKYDDEIRAILEKINKEL